MDQIALPFRIALVAIVLAGALWMTVLRPKGGDTASAPTPAPTAPGVAGLTRAVDKAKGAVATSAATNAKIDAASGGQDAAANPSTAAATPASGTAGAVAKPKAPPVAGVAAGDPSVPLVRALGEGKVVALLFAGTRAVDDRAARQALRGVGRHAGSVVVKTARPASVGRYEAITRGAKVDQFPTVLVIGPDKIAKPITGFTTGGEVDQVVADAVAAAAPARRVNAAQTAAEHRARAICKSTGESSTCEAFLVQANQTCTTGRLQELTADANALTNGETTAARTARHRADSLRTAAAMAGLPAPASLRTPHARAVALLKSGKAGKGTARQLTHLGYGACA